MTSKCRHQEAQLQTPQTFIVASLWYNKRCKQFAALNGLVQLSIARKQVNTGVKNRNQRITRLRMPRSFIIVATTKCCKQAVCCIVETAEFNFRLQGNKRTPVSRSEIKKNRAITNAMIVYYCCFFRALQAVCCVEQPSSTFDCKE